MNTLQWIILAFITFLLGRMTAKKPRWSRKHTIFTIVIIVVAILQFIFVHDIERFLGM
jgi:heme/copper-type cytochrome/quinol oxidase subunit 4